MHSAMVSTSVPWEQEFSPKSCTTYLDFLAEGEVDMFIVPFVGEVRLSEVKLR